LALLTTTIGAYPKPAYVKLPDWFKTTPDDPDPTTGWAQALTALGANAEAILSRATCEAINDQLEAGIDIPSEGEIRRENYIHYHCRHLTGIDFNRLTEKELRNGAYSARLPTVTGKVRAGKRFLVNDWKIAQGCSSRPVKITLPGPLTVTDTVADDFYYDPQRLGEDLADALNAEILALADAGCKHIQIDEPLFARKPQDALGYGMDHLERAFHRCPGAVVRTLHMCCGYPDRLDNPDYPKADPEAYLQLADALEYSSIDAVSIEDAHRHNDLSLLEKFAKTTVIFGAVAIARSRIEAIEEIRERLQHALLHIDGERLIVAPDCGLGLLGRDKALAKLHNMTAAARSL
jgi:5-methyltetrahydropteroyltriglutamate--homocysteine methyltransferase